MSGHAIRRFGEVTVTTDCFDAILTDRPDLVVWTSAGAANRHWWGFSLSVRGQAVAPSAPLGETGQQVDLFTEGQWRPAMQSQASQGDGWQHRCWELSFTAASAAAGVGVRWHSPAHGLELSRWWHSDVLAALAQRTQSLPILQVQGGSPG